jgi:hypothetical protein
MNPRSWHFVNSHSRQQRWRNLVWKQEHPSADRHTFLPPPTRATIIPYWEKSSSASSPRETTVPAGGTYPRIFSSTSTAVHWNQTNSPLELTMSRIITISKWNLGKSMTSFHLSCSSARSRPLNSIFERLDVDHCQDGAMMREAASRLFSPLPKPPHQPPPSPWLECSKAREELWEI